MCPPAPFVAYTFWVRLGLFYSVVTITYTYFEYLPFTSFRLLSLFTLIRGIQLVKYSFSPLSRYARWPRLLARDLCSNRKGFVAVLSLFVLRWLYDGMRMWHE